MAGYRKIALDLSEFFNLSLDMMCIASPTGEIVACNEAFLKGGGRTADEVAEMNYISLIHPDDLPDFLMAMERMVAGEPMPLLAFRYQHKEGHYVHSEWSCQPREGLLYASGRDVSARVETEARLVEATRRYETLTRLAPVGIFLSDSAGENVYANEKLNEINELEAAQADGLAWMNRIHPEDREAFLRRMTEVTAQRRSFHHEYRLKMPDGRVKWVQTNAEPQFEASGAISGYIGTVEDVTQRRQARHLMSLAGRIAKVGGWELDVSTNELEMSDEILGILEADPESEHSLEQILEVYAEPMRAQVQEALRQAVELGKSFDFEAEITSFKGTRKYIHVTGEAEMADGRCVRLSGVLQDITERMVAQRAERAANDKLRLLFERAPIGMALHRLGGDYIQSNAAYGKILGMSDEEAKGTNALEKILPEYADQVQTVFTDLMNKRSYGPIRTEMRRPDGSTVLTVSNGVMVRDISGDEYVWSMVEDITLSREIERTRAEHERELEAANRALQESNREIEEFTYAASHDLKEPLRTIIGFSELLEEDLKSGDKAAIAEDMRVIRGGATRMQRLVNDLLALSRSGKQVLNIAAVPLADCVRQAKADLQRQLEHTMADLQCDELPVVMADIEHLTRVLQNLIGNALKYQPLGRRPVIRVSATEHEEMCEVRVSDNGIGIDPKYHAKIFEAFKRLHGQSEYEGSGIGLAICRKTIERHGGTIRVESEQGKGSTFIFTLPLAGQLAEVSHG